MDLNDFLKKGRNPDGDNDSCVLTIKVYSAGLLKLSRDADDHFLYYALPRLLLQLALIFLLTQSLYILLKRFNMPRLVPKILAGIILGKSILRNVAEGVHDKLFPENDILLDTLSRFGFIFYIFLVGVKMDPSMILKVGTKAVTIGLAASVPPIVIGGMVISNLAEYLPLYRRPAVSTVIRILSLTPFPVIAILLIDLKIMNSEIGRLSLASALVADLVSKFSSPVINVFRVREDSSSDSLGWQSFFQSVVVVVVVLVGTRPLFSSIIKRTPEGKPVKQPYIVFICWAVLSTALLCANLGLQNYYIPFLLGLAIPVGPPLGSTLAIKLDTFIYGLLAPLMISNCALQIDLTKFYDLNFLGTVSFVTLASIALKFVFVLSLSLLNNLPIRDAVTLSIILTAQGIVQGSFYDIEYRSQTIDGETFSLVIIWLAILAAGAHICVKFLYDYSRTYTGYQKRNVMNTPNNSELRILACSQRADDALAAIKLLEDASPSREAPIAAYALNLVELVGRATPLIINHGLGQKNSSGDSRSQQTILHWKNFQQQSSGLVSVQAFTSMSLPKFMHFDICSVAFDKLASLIILPFHRKWNQYGKIIFESNLQRTINRKVLETSPCSVGILVDRRKIRNDISDDIPGHSRYNVAVIFLGGSDDREALAFAKRMAGSARVQLTVVRLVSSDEVSEDRWDTVLDREILREVKLMNMHRNNVFYREEMANDGPETALIVNEMVDVFDLIMVGRSHRENSPLLSGLSEWSEIQELGPIGDILASPDVNKPVSVLVVQQQVLK